MSSPSGERRFEDRLLRIPQVFSMLGISEATYYRHRNQGAIPPPVRTPFGPRHRESQILGLIEAWEGSPGDRDDLPAVTSSDG